MIVQRRTRIEANESQKRNREPTLAAGTLRSGFSVLRWQEWLEGGLKDGGGGWENEEGRHWLAGWLGASEGGTKGER